MHDNDHTVRHRTEFVRSLALSAVLDAGCPVSTTDVCRLVNQRHGHQLPRPLVTEQIYRAMIDLHRRHVVVRVPNSGNRRTAYWQHITSHTGTP